MKVPVIPHLQSLWKIFNYVHDQTSPKYCCLWQSVCPLSHFHSDTWSYPARDMLWPRLAFSEVRSVIHSPDGNIVLRFLDTKMKDFFGSLIPAAYLFPNKVLEEGFHLDLIRTQPSSRSIKFPVTKDLCSNVSDLKDAASNCNRIWVIRSLHRYSVSKNWGADMVF